MNKRINTILAFMALSSVLASTAYAGLLVTDGAGSVEAKQVEVELNGSYAYDKDGDGSDATRTYSTDGDITVTAGIVKGLDIAIGLPYTFNTREKISEEPTEKSDGFNDVSVDLKYQFLEMEGLKLAIKPGVILPTGKESEGLSDGKFGFTAALLATKEFAEGKYLLHANTGYERHNYEDADVKDTTRQDIFTFSIAAEAEVADGLVLALDMGLATSDDKESDIPPAYTLVGAKYEITEMLEGYAGVKFGITSPEDDVTALFGAVFTF